MQESNKITKEAMQIEFACYDLKQYKCVAFSINFILFYFSITSVNIVMGIIFSKIVLIFSIAN